MEPLARTTRRLAGALTGALLVLGGSAAEAQRADPAETQRAVSVVRLPLPLTGSGDQATLGRLQRAVDALRADPNATAERRPIIVLQFDPDESGGPTEFERALRLARFLVSDSLVSVKTIAYLPESVEGHAVLVALACEEIAMAPGAELGAAAADEDSTRPIEPSIAAAYEQIALARRTAPPAVVAAMVDRSAELLRVETEEGIEYALARGRDGLRAERTIVAEETLSPAGSLASFTGRQGREQGFVKYLAGDRAALARALGVAADRLQEDESLVGDWVPVMIDVEGPITPRLVRRVETLVGDELDRNGVNWIGLRIDSSGGDWPSALRLARTIAELGDGEARSVAYVAHRAEGPAALVALACDQLVMHEGAIVGDGAKPEAIGNDSEQEEGADDEDQPAPRVGLRLDAPDEEAEEEAQTEIDSVVATIRDSLSEALGKSWSPLAASVDRRIELARYANRQTGEERLLGEQELESLDDRADWRRGEVIKPAGEPLRLDGARAAEQGIAWRAIDQFDDLLALYGFGEPPRVAQPNWAIELVEALASPGFAALLLVVGVIGIYIELSTPGLGVGGFVAAVAFLLFFWSKFLDGTADWLEVLLFVAGLVFLLIEVFVLPGFGVFGLGGALMVLAGLVLASQTFILPKTESQLIELRNSLAVVAGSGVLCVAAAMVLRHYLPHTPLFRRAMLTPPDEADRIEQERREHLADYQHLVGKAGVATTDLLPAGRAEIDGEPVDVTTDGEAIDRGDSVEVVAAQANRVVVRKVRR